MAVGEIHQVQRDQQQQQEVAVKDDLDCPAIERDYLRKRPRFG